MRKATFFISSRSQSADFLAAELAIAVCDQFPKIEVSGIVGKWTGKTRVTPVAKLDEVQAEAVKAGEDAALAPLKAALAENLPQVAVLVGYSTLQQNLAGFFKQHAIPVILYEITPGQALQGVDLTEAAERIKFALSFHKTGSAFLRAAKIPFEYIGSPYRDRVAKVEVKPGAFPFLGEKKLVSLFPGGYGETVYKMLPMFSQLALDLMKDCGCQIVVSLREEQDFDATVKAIQKNLGDAEQKVKFVLGMHLELLSLSQLAIVGPGAITIEAAILEVPFVSVYDTNTKPDEFGHYTLINQSVGQTVVPEHASTTPSSELLATAKALFGETPARKDFLRKLSQVQGEFQGSATEHAADVLAIEAGLTHKKPRTAAPSA